MLKAGRALVYEPRAVVRHRHRRDMHALCGQIRDHGISFSSYVVRIAGAPIPRSARALARLWAWWLAKTLFRMVRPKGAPAGPMRRLALAELARLLARRRPIPPSPRAPHSPPLVGVSEPADGGVMTQVPLVSVVMPCLNEEEAIGPCIEKIRAHLRRRPESMARSWYATMARPTHSVAIAERMGARVVHQPLRGYGNAYINGFAEARGRYLVMGDADDTYDFTMIPQFLARAAGWP